MPKGVYQRTDKQKRTLSDLARVNAAKELTELEDNLAQEFLSVFPQGDSEETRTLLGILPTISEDGMEEFINNVKNNPYDIDFEIAFLDYQRARIQTQREIYLKGRKRFSKKVEDRLFKYEAMLLDIVEMKKKMVETKFKMETADFITPDDFTKFLGFIYMAIKTEVKDELERDRLIQKLKNSPKEMTAVKK